MNDENDHEQLPEISNIDQYDGNISLPSNLSNETIKNNSEEEEGGDDEEDEEEEDEEDEEFDILNPPALYEKYMRSNEVRIPVRKPILANNRVAASAELPTLAVTNHHLSVCCPSVVCLSDGPSIHQSGHPFIHPSMGSSGPATNNDSGLMSVPYR